MNTLEIVLTIGGLLIAGGLFTVYYALRQLIKELGFLK